jgi:two-component system, NtrC family, response regulator AtoC
MSATILIVDDEPLVRMMLIQTLERAGFRCLEAETMHEAEARWEAGGADLVLLDYRLPDGDGMVFLRRVRELDPECVVIMMTAFSSVERAVEAMKQGAFHYLRKPFEIDELLVLVDKALETTRLRREVKTLLANQSAPYAFDRIIGESTAMLEIKQVLRRIAESPASTVLLVGESGTGKDLAAKAIHFNSARAGRPFMNITCSALPDALLESELFGHEKGAFTDAKQTKRGLLELADGGTVFLDEITEMSTGLQSKLLRFLEEKSFRRVGGAVDLHVDVRIIAATNRNLDEAVPQGVLRRDLYYRLQVFPVRLPPLRERAGDLRPLALYFVDLFNREFKRKVKSIDADALALFEAHPWEGNVRELRNVMERAMLFAEGEALEAKDFDSLARGAPTGDGFSLPPAGLDFDALERSLVIQALKQAHGNRTRAASLLGMSRDQMRYRIEKFGLS